MSINSKHKAAKIIEIIMKESKKSRGLSERIAYDKDPKIMSDFY